MPGGGGDSGSSRRGAAPAPAHSSSAQQPQHHHQQQPSTQQAVLYVCRLLRGCGVGSGGRGLTPEVLRQAKFGAPLACQPLLHALHDLVLLVAAGPLPAAAAGGSIAPQAMQRLRSGRLVQDGSTAVGVLTQPGRTLVLHHLAAWGCPFGLVVELAPDPPSSTSVLLALCWLVGHARLFESALQQLQVPLELAPLLPPYPEDPCHTPAAQQRRAAAVAAACQHSQRVQDLTRSQAACASSSSSSSSDWQAVHTAAQHVLSTYRAATLRLQQLTALHEGRERLLHTIHQEQQQQQQQQQHQAPAVLTAFELHLLAHPQLLQQHHAALAEACSLLEQQQQCVQHAHAFFAWAASAIGRQHAPGAAGAGTSVGPPVLPGPPLGDVQPLVDQLPDANSPLAVGMLHKVAQQLQQAADGLDGGRAASSSSSSSSWALRRPGEHTTTRVAAAAAADGLAGLSLAAGAEPGSDDAAAVARFTQTAAAALVRAGVLPDLRCPEMAAGLPADLCQALQRSTRAQRRQQEQRTALAAQVQDGKMAAAWQRTLEAPAAAAANRSGRQQQHQQHQQARAGAAAAASDQLQVLAGHALDVAKQLAKARAANKRALSAAADALLAAGDDGGGKVVLFQG